MAYVKFHDPWNSGSCCGTPDAGPDTPITKGACNHWETGIFNAAAVADTALADAATAQSTANSAQSTANTAQSDATTALGNAAAADANANNRVLRTGDTMSGPLTIGNATPTVANLQSVTAGDSVARFSVLANGTLQWSDGTLAPDVDLFRSAAGSLRTGSNFSIFKTTSDAELRVSAAAGFNANLRLRTGTLDRWIVQKHNIAESGGNAGSDFMLNRYNDAGVLIDSPFYAIRSTGVCFITTPGIATGAVVSVDGAQPLSNKTYSGFGATAGTINLTERVTGDANPRYALYADGKQEWSNGAGAADTNLARTGTGILGTNASVVSTRVAAVPSFSAQVTGDTVPRWSVSSSGVVSYSSGSAAADFTMSRTGVGVLGTNGEIVYTGSGTTLGFGARVTADTNDRVALRNDGAVVFGPGNSAVDTILNRTAANTLQAQTFVTTLGNFSNRSSSTLACYTANVAGDAFGRHVIAASGQISWGPGNATQDTNLYRGAADQLKTDDSLMIGGNVGFYNTTPVAKPTVTGSKGANAALASLLTALASQGLITDSSS